MPTHLITRGATAAILMVLPLLAGAAPAPTTKPARVDLPSFGISVPIPAGFVRDTDNQTSAVWFVPARSEEGKPGLSLHVDVVPTPGAKAADVAAASARAEGLVPGRADARWGGGPAIAHVARAAGKDDRPSGDLRVVRQLVREHEGMIYRVRLATDAAHAGDVRAIDELAAGTRWLPVAHAGRGVAARWPRLPLRNGMIVRIPDPFRPDMRSPAKLTMPFFAADLPTRRMAAKLLVIPLPVEEGAKDVEAMKAAAERNLAESLGLKELFRWEAPVANARKPERGKASSTFAETPRLKTADGWSQVLVACVGDNPATVFCLQCGGDDDVLEGMERVMPLLRESIEDAAEATLYLRRNAGAGGRGKQP